MSSVSSNKLKLMSQRRLMDAQEEADYAPSTDSQACTL